MKIRLKKWKDYIDPSPDEKNNPNINRSKPNPSLDEKNNPNINKSKPPLLDYQRIIISTGYLFLFDHLE